MQSRNCTNIARSTLVGRKNNNFTFGDVSAELILSRNISFHRWTSELKIKNVLDGTTRRLSHGDCDFSLHSKLGGTFPFQKCPRRSIRICSTAKTGISAQLSPINKDSTRL